MQEGRRVALDLVSHRRLRYRVASRTPITEKFVGHFALDHDTFDRALGETFDEIRGDVLIYIDEIGSLYCQSGRFVNTIAAFLEHHTMIASLQTKGHGLVGRIAQTPHAKIWNVNGTNRDDVPMEIMRELFPER